MHIILVINKGWLKVLFILSGILLGVISYRTVTECLGTQFRVYGVHFQSDPSSLCSPFSQHAVSAEFPLLGSLCTSLETSWLALPGATGPITCPSLCLATEFLLICHMLHMSKVLNLFLLMMVFLLILVLIFNVSSVLLKPYTCLFWISQPVEIVLEE